MILNPNSVNTSPLGAQRAIRWVLSSLGLTIMLASLGTSIANVSLPTLMLAFNASFPQVQWVVLAYLLASTILIVSAGRLGDLFGRRRMLLRGIALFSVATVLCALAPDLEVLIAARVLQGLGAALMMSLAMALVGEAIPKENTGSAMGILGTVSAIGTALGPPLGGLLIALGGWPWLFLINAPLGVLAWWLVKRHIPTEQTSFIGITPRFDGVGSALLALTLAAYALAMTVAQGEHRIALLALSGLGLGLFIHAQQQTGSPLIQLSLLRMPILCVGFAASSLVTTVVMATLVVGPFYLAGALSLDATEVGLSMAAGPIMAALVGVPAGRIVDWLGAQRISLVGLLVMAVGATLLWRLPASCGVAGYMLSLIVLTAGYALFQVANNTVVMSHLAPPLRGVGAGLLGLSRNLGLITGASVMGWVFTFGAGGADLFAATPTAIAAGLRFTFGVAGAVLLVAVGLVAGFGWSTLNTAQSSPE